MGPEESLRWFDEMKGHIQELKDIINVLGDSEYEDMKETYINHVHRTQKGMSRRRAERSSIEILMEWDDVRETDMQRLMEKHGC
jgi:hypothetical protein